MKLIPLWEVILTPRRFRLARVWSNRLLNEIADKFEGSIVNVSAWEDSDKEGNSYRNYFKNCSEYSITNYGGESGSCQEQCYSLDLENNLPEELKERFDVVFNHTSLEHIFDIFTAVKSLCLMSLDVVIVVVPFTGHTLQCITLSDY